MAPETLQILIAVVFLIYAVLYCAHIEMERRKVSIIIELLKKNHPQTWKALTASEGGAVKTFFHKQRRWERFLCNPELDFDDPVTFTMIEDTRNRRRKFRILWIVFFGTIVALTVCLRLGVSVNATG